jgi:hypothetical protein
MNELQRIEPFSIPMLIDDTTHDACNRYYRRALLNTLLKLRPTYCLEIGTYTYQTSQVFSCYFETYNPNGKLITTDISEWDRGGAPPNVYPVMVYPHTLNVEKFHGGINIFYPNWRKKLESGGNSVLINGDIINRKMDELDIDEHFDFVFVDGDHQEKSFLSDLYIALALTKPDGYILIDDVRDPGNEQMETYRNTLCKKNSFYEFEDWDTNPGMALIRAGDLKL